MTTRMDESTPPPSAWVDALDEHDHDLERVRLLWRRGSGRYRPLLRPGVDPDDLEHSPMSEWDAHEMPDAHTVWNGDVRSDSVEHARVRIERVAAHFWRLAVEWTRTHGPICDIQLRGYAADGAVLFEAGKRCNLTAGPRRSGGDEARLVDARLVERVEQERAERERVEHDRDRDRDFHARREARLMADVNQIHHTYGDLLGSLKRERDEAFSVTQETVRMVPDLFAQASKVIHESIDQHREQVRRSLDHASGDREYQVRAFSQHQETIRHDKTMGFLLNAVQAGVGALGPLAAQILETIRGRPATAGGLLEFQCAQQALAYLHLTLTPLQLKHLFPTSAADFMAVLDTASRCDDESEALRGLRGMEVVFKTPAWGQAAQPDQALAGRYVLGRIAMLRIYKTAAESAGVAG